jgi:plastocyanin
MQRNVWSPARMTSTLTYKRGAWLCLLVLGALIFLAACGSNATTTGSSAPAAASSPTSTSDSGNTTSGYGYGGKYGHGGSSSTPTTAVTGATQTVTIIVSGSGFAFSPATLTIPVGTTVVWKNISGTSHTVTSDDGKTCNPGNATPVNPGSTFSFKFTTPGTYNYHCNFHPTMLATIIVK